MEEMIREAIMNMMGEEIENIIAELITEKIKAEVEEWYIIHDLKTHINQRLEDEYVITNDDIEDEIDAYIEGCINEY